MKYVTIATDISIDPRRKISTWACYIRYGGGVIKRVGEFKEYDKRSAWAETYALVNALAIAKKEIPDWSESKVIIHNEIEHVLTPVLTKAGNVKKRDEIRTEAIRNIALPILQGAVDWERRKIKAHTKNWKSSSSPAKYAMNDWCDKASRNYMKELRRTKYKK